MLNLCFRMNLPDNSSYPFHNHIHQHQVEIQHRNQSSSFFWICFWICFIQTVYDSIVWFIELCWFQYKDSKSKVSTDADKERFVQAGPIHVIQKGGKEVLTLRKPNDDNQVNTHKPQTQLKEDVMIGKDRSIKTETIKHSNMRGTLNENGAVPSTKISHSKEIHVKC